MVRMTSPPPRNLKEAGDRIDALRPATRWALAGVALLVAALPLVTWLAVSVGERGRDSNCRVIEQTFYGYDAAFAQALADAGLRHPDPVEQAKAQAAFVGDLDAKVADLMANCDG